MRRPDGGVTPMGGELGGGGDAETGACGCTSNWVSEPNCNTVETWVIDAGVIPAR